MERIEKHKETVVETRGSADFKAIINDFESKLKDETKKGAVSFSWCVCVFNVFYDVFVLFICDAHSHTLTRGLTGLFCCMSGQGQRGS